MSRKQIFAAGVLGCLAMAVGIVLSVLYFRKEQETVSAVHLAPVHLELCLLNSEEGYEAEQVTGLLPGESSVWEPAVILDGTSPDAYIRIRLEFGGIFEEQPGEDEEKSAERRQKIQELCGGIWFCDGWLEGENNYYYYQDKVSAGNIVPVCSQVTIPDEWDNDVAEKTFTIEVSAEAVRSDWLESWIGKDQEIRSWE